MGELAGARRDETAPAGGDPPAHVDRAATGGVVGRARRRLHVSESAAPYVLVGPATVLLLVFAIGPTVASLVVALFDWNLLAGTRELVGLDNFRRVLGDDGVWNSVRVTALYAVMTVPTSMAAGLAAAVAIARLRRGQSFWRAVYFLPVASTLAAMAVAWRWLYYPSSGLVDSTVGRLLGVENWLNSPTWALPALAIIGVWRGVGFTTVVYLAGLTAVPRDTLDAAEVDGAGAWRRFWHVTWPALGPTTLFALIISTIQAISVFDPVVVLTEGGPVDETETLTYLLWERGVGFGDFGGAAVVGVLLSALVTLVAVWQIRGVGRRLEDAGTR